MTRQKYNGGDMSENICLGNIFEVKKMKLSMKKYYKTQIINN